MEETELDKYITARTDRLSTYAYNSLRRNDIGSKMTIGQFLQELQQPNGGNLASYRLLGKKTIRELQSVFEAPDVFVEDIMALA